MTTCDRCFKPCQDPRRVDTSEGLHIYVCGDCLKVVRRRLFNESLKDARVMSAKGYFWLAALYVNKARIYGRVTAKHLREIGVTQDTGG